MKSLSSVDIYFLVKELQMFIGGKIDKIFQTGREEFYLSVHVPGTGKKLIYISFPSLLMVAGNRFTEGKEPPQFCMMLRKHLSNKRIRKIEQKGSERIVCFLFEGKEEKYKMYIELFGSKGNLILAKEDETIISALWQKRWSSRDIRGGVKYALPSAKDSFSLDNEKFSEIIRHSGNGSVVSAVAIGLSIGGPHAEELCARAGIEKSLDVDKIKPHQVSLLFESWKKMLGEKPKGYAYFRDGSLEIISPFPFITLSGDMFSVKEYSSFLSALEDNLSMKQAERRLSDKEKEKNKKLEILMKTIEKQELSIRRLTEDARTYEDKGNKIYEHYQEVKDLIEEARKMEGFSSEEMKEKIKNTGKIKSINKKEKTFEVSCFI